MLRIQEWTGRFKYWGIIWTWDIGSFIKFIVVKYGALVELAMGYDSIFDLKVHSFWIVIENLLALTTYRAEHWDHMAFWPTKKLEFPCYILLCRRFAFVHLPSANETSMRSFESSGNGPESAQKRNLKYFLLKGCGSEISLYICRPNREIGSNKNTFFTYWFKKQGMQKP